MTVPPLPSRLAANRSTRTVMTVVVAVGLAILMAVAPASAAVVPVPEPATLVSANPADQTPHARNGEARAFAPGQRVRALMVCNLIERKGILPFLQELAQAVEYAKELCGCFKPPSLDIRYVGSVGGAPDEEQFCGVLHANPLYTVEKRGEDAVADAGADSDAGHDGRKRIGLG